MQLRCSLLSLVVIATGFLPLGAAAMFFHDVPDTHPYAESIEFLRQHEIVEGFVVPGEYRVFWPESSVTRAEFTKMIVHALAPQTLIEECLSDESSLQKFGLGMSFVDVERDTWFAPSLCVAWSYGLVSGYGDGTFRPDRPISLAEGSKILSVAFSLAPVAVPDLDPLATEWYQPYLHYMSAAGAIPSSARGASHVLTRAEMAEMLARLLKLPSEQAPADRIALDVTEVTNPVTWAEERNEDLGFSVFYPSSWPVPYLMSRGSYDGTILPKTHSLWKLYIGPKKECWGWNACIETDFSLTGFHMLLLEDALTELEDAANVMVLSDKTVDHVRTILYEETTPTCTTRSAFIITPRRFQRFTLHCGSKLHNPETAFMRMLAKLKVSKT